MRIAAITLFSAARLEHFQVQQRILAELPEPRPAIRVVVWLDAAPAPVVEGAIVLHEPPGRLGMRLAAGRNRGARAAIDAGAELLVFLDVDCLPGRALFARYAAEAQRHPHSVLCGPVTYLGEQLGPLALGDLHGLTEPHPARPLPADDEARVAEPTELDLFWSLSFAMSGTDWASAGGFHEGYEGYGGEDTDFARVFSESGIGMVWVGGAHAYHQWHPTASPPWQHLDDILRNGALFARRWGRWPMAGWLDAFEAAGAIVRDGPGWRRS